MILLTGSTGYLGPAIMHSLKGKKLRCLVRINSSASLKKSDCEIVVGNVTDAFSLKAAVKGVSVVIHCAALIKEVSKGDYNRVNIEGTRNLVAAAKSAKVNHFIFLSSILAAYPKLTPYGRSKLDAEQVVKDSGVPYTILRISLVYKPGDDKTIGSVASLVRKFPVLPLLGYGKSVLQPVAIDNVASAVSAAASGKARNMTHFIAGPAITFREMLRIISSSLGLKRLFVPVPVSLLKAALRIYSIFTRQNVLTANQLDSISSGMIFDYSSAEKHLGFSPVSFECGFKKYKKHLN